MIEQQIRDLFAETADGEPTPAQVDVPLARRRGGWAVLSIPVRDLTTLRHSPVLEAETLKIARNAQFGAATPHLLFAAKFTGLPGDWRLTDAHYYADSGKLHAEDYTLRTARSRFLWQTGDLGYWTDAAYVIARPVPGGGTCAGDGPGSTRRIEIINGLRVVVQRYTEQGQPIHDLCAAHINGFWFDVQEFGPHPSIGVTRLFRDHVHLLGRNPANWTRSPLG